MTNPVDLGAAVVPRTVPVIEVDAEGVHCRTCGVTLKTIGSHLLRSHGFRSMKRHERLRLLGLPAGTRFAREETRVKYRANMAEARVLGTNRGKGFTTMSSAQMAAYGRQCEKSLIPSPRWRPPLPTAADRAAQGLRVMIRGRVVMTCASCKFTYTRRRWEMNHHGGHLTYCSQQCSRDANAARRRAAEAEA